ncbi:MAG: phosphonate C-P lyase system protein PhnG [Mastigocoleus sp. MO_167.B18]|nr:phosphonate C-P lyase system protein PhnG [Mastigocoleus sp. MO_167.B18]
MIEIPRNQWVRALTAHSETIVIELANRLRKDWEVTHEALPETGLSLLKMQDGVFEEPYYLGEIPLSTAWVKLTAKGETWEGAASVMNDTPGLAVALAICDAILANQLPGWQQILPFVEQGALKKQEEEAFRGAMLAKTRVNLSLLTPEVDD